MTSLLLVESYKLFGLPPIQKLKKKNIEGMPLDFGGIS